MLFIAGIISFVACGGGSSSSSPANNISFDTSKRQTIDNSDVEKFISMAEMGTQFASKSPSGLASGVGCHPEGGEDAGSIFLAL